MMIGLLTMLAVVSAVLVWQWRPHHPVIAAALWIGQVGAAAAATSAGAALPIGATARSTTSRYR